MRNKKDVEKQLWTMLAKSKMRYHDGDGERGGGGREERGSSVRDIYIYIYTHGAV